MIHCRKEFLRFYRNHRKSIYIHFYIEMINKYILKSYVYIYIYLFYKRRMVVHLTFPWMDTTILCAVPHIYFSMNFSKVPNSSLLFLFWISVLGINLYKFYEVIFKKEQLKGQDIVIHVTINEKIPDSCRSWLKPGFWTKYRCLSYDSSSNHKKT
jgi:hypothetical protein